MLWALIRIASASSSATMIFRLSVLRKTVLNPEYMYDVLMCDCEFVNGCKKRE